MRNKVVPYNKMSKKKQKEARDRNRILFGHQQCPIVEASAKDKNRKREKEELAELKKSWKDQY